MGYYINPKDKTKEAWLAENKIQESLIPPSTDDFHKAAEREMCFVCLVDNGPFTAAAIAYSEGEMQVFSDPHDRRPSKWFLVSKEKILEVEPSVAGRGIFDV